MGFSLIYAGSHNCCQGTEGAGRIGRSGLLFLALGQAPHSLHKAVGTGKAVPVKGIIPLRRTLEQEEEAQSISTEIRKDELKGRPAEETAACNR